MSVVNLHECPIFRASDTSDHDKATWERTVRLCEPGVNAAVYRWLVRRTSSVPVLFFLCFPLLTWFIRYRLVHPTRPLVTSR